VFVDTGTVWHLPHQRLDALAHVFVSDAPRGVHVHLPPAHDGLQRLMHHADRLDEFRHRDGPGALQQRQQQQLRVGAHLFGQAL
jgi:hypothetical protein